MFLDLFYYFYVSKTSEFFLSTGKSPNPRVIQTYCSILLKCILKAKYFYTSTITQENFFSKKILLQSLYFKSVVMTRKSNYLYFCSLNIQIGNTVSVFKSICWSMSHLVTRPYNYHFCLTVWSQIFCYCPHSVIFINIQLRENPLMTFGSIA